MAVEGSSASYGYRGIARSKNGVDNRRNGVRAWGGCHSPIEVLCDAEGKLSKSTDNHFDRYAARFVPVQPLLTSENPPALHRSLLEHPLKNPSPLGGDAPQYRRTKMGVGQSTRRPVISLIAVPNATENPSRASEPTHRDTVSTNALEDTVNVQQSWLTSAKANRLSRPRSQQLLQPCSGSPILPYVLWRRLVNVARHLANADVLVTWRIVQQAYAMQQYWHRDS